MNCKAELYGGFCHVCGQENIEPKETFWGLISHFFYDITHFDGKFFSTLKYLLVKPGFLSKEYVTGKRMSYLHPVKMYVFTSAVFFLYIFSTIHLKTPDLGVKGKVISDSVQTNIVRARAEALKGARTARDSARIGQVIEGISQAPILSPRDSTGGNKKRSVYSNLSYKSKAEYDSIQQSLPESDKDGWLKRTWTGKILVLTEKISDDPDVFLKDWANKLFHKFPQLLFISLPFFALILKLLYVRSKNYYYGDHAIFTIHLYIFTFILLFLFLITNSLKASVGWGWLTYLQMALALYMFFYAYKAMRNFYQQGRIKTILKFWLLGFMSFSLIIFLFLCFIILSIYEI